MLVTEFSRKYNIPKSLVYEMSFKTDTRMNSPWITDIPERELVEAVASALEQRIAYYDGMSERFSENLKTLTAFIEKDNLKSDIEESLKEQEEVVNSDSK